MDPRSSDFQYQYFVNCSISLCETNSGVFLSSVGVCNQTTQLCMCPEGYNGEDVWATWNDCHINIYQRDVLEICALVLSAISLVAALLGLVTLLIKWEVIYWGGASGEPFELAAKPPSRLTVVRSPDSSKLPTSDGSNRLLPSPLPLLLSEEPSRAINDSPSAPAQRKSRTSMLPKANLSELFLEPKANGTNSFQQLQAEQRRRRNTAAVVISWICTGSCVFTFMLLRVLYKVRIEQNNHLLLLSMGSAVFFTLFSLWLQVYTWFSNLPSLRLFSGMFPKIKNNILVRFPFLLRNILILNAVVFFLACEICWWILPVFVGVQGQDMAKIVFTISSAEVLFFAFVSNSVSMILIRLFRTFENGNELDAPTSGKKKRKFTNGENTVKTMVFLTSIAAPFFAVWMLVFCWNDAAFQFCIILFCGIAVAATLASLVSTYIFVFRMSGAKTSSPRNRATTLSSRQNQPVGRQSKRASAVVGAL
ncbi:hypothetical protein BASA81_005429 [Batrachochytrium salamandrivorans]|nr:hypothetical protein BASA81_005429 [Batrachochytrium salamandrivorans]